MASRALDDDLGSHGYPMSLATDPAIRGRVSAHRSVDFIQQKIDAEREKSKKEYPNDPQHGSIWSATVADQ